MSTTFPERLVEAADALKVAQQDREYCLSDRGHDLNKLDESTFYIALGDLLEWSPLPEADKLAVFAKYVPGEGWAGEQLVHAKKHVAATDSPATAGISTQESVAVIDETVEAEIVDELPELAYEHPLVTSIRDMLKTGFRVLCDASREHYVALVRGIQSSIDDDAVQFERRVSSKLRLLQFLERVFGNDLKSYCIRQLENAKGKKKKYIDCESGRVSFRQTGGPKMHDKQMVEAYIKTLLPEESYSLLQIANVFANSALEGSGGRVEWSVKLDHTTLKMLVDGGATIPGYGKSEIDKYGKIAIGGDKPWTPNAAKARISAAFGKYGLVLENEDDEEDAA